MSLPFTGAHAAVTAAAFIVVLFGRVYNAIALISQFSLNVMDAHADHPM